MISFDSWLVIMHKRSVSSRVCTDSFAISYRVYCHGIEQVSIVI